MAFVYDEGTEGSVLNSDVRVNFTKMPTTPGIPNKVNNVSFLGVGPTGSGSGNALIDLSDTGAVSSVYGSSYTEAVGIGTIDAFWMETYDTTEVSNVLQIAAAYGSTLVVDYSISKNYQDFIALSNSYPELMIMFTQSDIAINVNGLAGIGVMNDTEIEGKALFAVTTMLGTPSFVRFANTIKGSFKAGVVDLGLRQAMINLGVSFFFMASNEQWLASLQYGGIQAFKIYWEQLVLQDIRSMVNQFVGQGNVLNDASLLTLNNRLSVVLSNYEQLYDTFYVVQTPTFSRIPITSALQGEVVGVSLSFSVGNEIMRVSGVVQ